MVSESKQVPDNIYGNTNYLMSLQMLQSLLLQNSYKAVSLWYGGGDSNLRGASGSSNNSHDLRCIASYYRWLQVDELDALLSAELCCSYTYWI